MTDRHSGYVVTLSDDIREDEAQGIINALTLIKGVVSVQPIAGDYQLVVAKERVRGEYRQKLLDLLKELQ